MPGTYQVLAPVYDKIGMSEFARKTIPRLINFAQRNDWTGRRIIDLGCGTGGSAIWLCQNRFTVTGVDTSPEMLERATAGMDEKTQPLFRAVQQDIRSLGGMDNFDLAVAMNTLNEMDSLRDLERMFNNVKNALGEGRLFMFDLYTIEGLTRRGETDSVVDEKDAGLLVITRDQYDYDRQVHTRHYTIFTQSNDGWHREDATRVLRGYPVQAVATLLQRCGFSMMGVFDEDFEAFEPGGSSALRVIFAARKPG